MVSRIVRSSTYFARLGHVLIRSLTITENSDGDARRLAWGVLGKTPSYLAVKVSFRVALEEILKNYIFSIRFIYLIQVIKV